MYKNKNYITVMLLFIAAVFNGCSDDLMSNAIGSTLEEDGDYKISTFTLSNDVMGADETLESVIIILTSGEGHTLEFYASVTVDESLFKCRMRIPKTETVPDGEYLLTARVPDGPKLGGRVSVIFKDEMLHTVQGTAVEYTDLEGDGSWYDPYIINSKDDFKALINNLRRDSKLHGAGLYFKQTATFDAPSQSELYDGRGYFNYSFAGNYDGGGFAIENLYYVGAKDPEKDSGIGLFAELLSGAVIKDLNINNFNIINTVGDCGALAGRSTGTVTVSNVNVSGSIVDGGSNCGGLIGSTYDNSHLSVDGYDFSVAITGDDCIGGVIGATAQTNSYTTIHNVSTDEHRFSVSGRNDVGGIIGYMGGSFHISRVVLEHSVSSEDGDLRIVSGSGNNTGGIIGDFAGSASGDCSLDSIKVKCPVGGSGSGTGGLIGKLCANKNLTINYCQVMSVVSGGDDVGGLAGSCVIDMASGVTFTGTDNLTKVVVDDAAASVSGVSNVGGLFGSLTGGGSLSFDSKVRVAINVTSSDRNCGGAFGYVTDATIDLTNLIFDSTSMHVNGGGECSGGVIGYMGNSTITGPSANEVEYQSGSQYEIPQYSRFTPLFKGEVTGVNKNGGIVGKMENSTIRNLSSQCTVTGNGQYTGGLIGYLTGNCTVENCTFGAGKIVGKGNDVGGIVGLVEKGGSITKCINYAPVDGNGGVAGIIGTLDYTEKVSPVSWCVNVGAINSRGLSTGGVIGYLHGASDYQTVQKCANYGAVVGAGGSNSDSAIGGIVGFCRGKKIQVLYCANHGDIYSAGSQHGIGGVAGSLGEDPNGVYASQNLELGYCCNRGSISCDAGDAHIGGILGYQEEGAIDLADHDSWLHDCVNYGDITSDQNDDNGGILGCADHYSFIEKSVNLGSIRGGSDNAVIGTHKSSCIFYHENLYYLEGSGKSWCADYSVSEANKGKQESYSKLDFTSIWEIKDGEPALRDCPFLSVTFQ